MYNGHNAEGWLPPNSLHRVLIVLRTASPEALVALVPKFWSSSWLVAFSAHLCSKLDCVHP